MLTIIDYGLGNLGSIHNMFDKIGVETVVSSDLAEIKKATKLVLPGVGAFDNGIDKLKELNLLGILEEKVLGNKIPILGICLGMQLFAQDSEEGTKLGLGWIKAKTVKFKTTGLKIPHMGWNVISPRKESVLFMNMPEQARFYFVHSYHVVCQSRADILATTNYGEDFVSALEKDNIFGVQFHPEKSHKYGLKLLKNFVELT